MGKFRRVSRLPKKKKGKKKEKGERVWSTLNGKENAQRLQ